MYRCSTVSTASGWEGKNTTDGLDSVLRNPQTAHQHKSITIRSGPADLKYKELSQQVFVCVHVRLCVCVCIHTYDICQHASIPYGLALCVLAVCSTELLLVRPTSHVPLWYFPVIAWMSFIIVQAISWSPVSFQWLVSAEGCTLVWECMHKNTKKKVWYFVQSLHLDGNFLLGNISISFIPHVASCEKIWRRWLTLFQVALFAGKWGGMMTDGGEGDRKAHTMQFGPNTARNNIGRLTHLSPLSHIS